MVNKFPANPIRNTARANLKFGSFEAEMEVNVTPRGLVAIGFLVSSILVSVTPIILAATRKMHDN